MSISTSPHKYWLLYDPLGCSSLFLYLAWPLDCLSLFYICISIPISFFNTEKKRFSFTWWTHLIESFVVVVIVAVFVVVNFHIPISFMNCLFFSFCFVWLFGWLKSLIVANDGGQSRINDFNHCSLIMMLMTLMTFCIFFWISGIKMICSSLVCRSRVIKRRNGYLLAGLAAH